MRIGHQDQTIDMREVRAVRLKKLRSLVHMSRRAFAAYSGIRESTLQNWEAPRHGGLTEQGAQKIVSCFKGLQVYFDIDWLMYGKGRAPEKQDKVMQGLSHEYKKSSVKDDVQFMKSTYHDAVIYRVTDDSMSPVVPEGTVVMGRRIHLSEYSALGNQLCVCLTESGEMLFRYVRPAQDPQRFDLLLLNGTTSSKQHCLYGRRLRMLAPAFWFRYDGALDDTT